MISYVGIDKRGSSRTGQGTMDATEFVETCFDLGWRRLTVMLASTGAVVGTISTSDATGTRIWWAES